MGSKTGNLVLRPITERELTPALFAVFDRFQKVEKCWRKIGGEWVIKDIAFLEQWEEKDYRELCASLQSTLKSGGAVWGLFLAEKLKGFCAVKRELLGRERQYADLSELYISADQRGKGYGRLLFQKAAELGLRFGAKKLYISAHSSVESQAFYRKMGCVEAGEYDPHHVAAEPCNCQLEYVL